jgi:hypothetical protein
MRRNLVSSGARNVTVGLAAGQQYARLVSELFGVSTFGGWIEVEASVAGLGVFVATGAWDMSELDGLGAQTALKVVFAAAQAVVDFGAALGVPLGDAAEVLLEREVAGVQEVADVVDDALIVGHETTPRAGRAGLTAR